MGPERLKSLTIHHGHHTSISHALAADRTLAEVMRATGHTNISITSAYLHVARLALVPSGLTPLFSGATATSRKTSIVFFFFSCYKLTDLRHRARPLGTTIHRDLHLFLVPRQSHRRRPGSCGNRAARLQALESRYLLSADLTASNVLVLYNPASTSGVQIANYYAQVHPGVHLLAITGVNPNSEDITADAYLSTIRPQVLSGLTSSIDVIVTTKGLPLRITVTEPEPTAVWPTLPTYVDPSGTLRSILNWQVYSSLESELTNIKTVSTWQMMGDQSYQILGQFSDNPYYHSTSAFTSSAFGGMYLTSRLDGYSVSDVENAINRAECDHRPEQRSCGARWFLVDNDPSINYGRRWPNWSTMC